ncbi:MAG: Crp/Fnr family transcriptional regulator [Sphingomonadaceae bacterium]|nr:Crp/Fnr family transcriptional regulator [Sphingomonadaceae bacterium]
MTILKAPLAGGSPLLTRLSRLTRLDDMAVEALQTAARDVRRSPPRRELISEGEPIRERYALLAGWACRQRILSDGRRQILSFLLPGDLIGVCQHSNPLAATTIIAISELVTCPAPVADPGSALAEAYARSAALEERYMLAHITRLGRFDARERLADWLLETQQRLATTGLSVADQFPLPLTQEMLADALGLTSVHVNRTLQAMRRDGLLILRQGMAFLPDRDQLEKLVEYKPARVSAGGENYATP